MTYYPEPFVWKAVAVAFLAGFVCAWAVLRCRCRRRAGLDVSETNKRIPYPLK